MTIHALKELGKYSFYLDNVPKYKVRVILIKKSSLKDLLYIPTISSDLSDVGSRAGCENSEASFTGSLLTGL